MHVSTTQRSAYLLLLLTTLFWGGNAVAGKLAVGHVSPMMLTTLRWSLALAMLLPFSVRHLRTDWPAIRAHAGLLALLAALGFTLFNVGLYGGALFTSGINLSIEQASIALFVLLANFLLFRVKVTGGQVAGFLITIVGVLVTASHGEFARLVALDFNVGDLIMFGGVAAYGIYTVALRYRPAIHWQSLMAALSLGAVLSSLPFAFGEWLAGATLMPDAQGWAIVLYTAVFPTILAQVFYIRGVELIGANRASLFINLVPIFGTLLSLLVLRETLHLYHAAAIALVLGGIAVAETSGRRAAGMGPREKS